jgi:hypothetical protein
VLAPRRLHRQWRADLHVRLDDLVDRLGDELGIAAVHGVMEASERGLVGRCLGC